MDRVIYDLLEESLHSHELVDKEWYILGCLANVLLVLKGGRLAYLVNNTIEKELVMFKAVLQGVSELAALSASTYELLLVRKENKVQVETMLREEVADSHLALAKILGYAYQGLDWRSGDRYAITYHFRYQGIKNRLLTFMVPVTGYDEACRTRIEESVFLFNSLLGEYDFTFYSESELFLDSTK